MAISEVRVSSVLKGTLHRAHESRPPYERSVHSVILIPPVPRCTVSYTVVVNGDVQAAQPGDSSKQVQYSRRLVQVLAAMDNIHCLDSIPTKSTCKNKI